MLFTHSQTSIHTESTAPFISKVFSNIVKISYSIDQNFDLRKQLKSETLSSL